MIRAKQRPESMLRNRKIQCQSALAARIPPMTGPRLGAMLSLEITSQYIVRPESASNDIHARIVQHRQTFLVRAARSATTLMASAMVSPLSVSMRIQICNLAVSKNLSYRCIAEPSKQLMQLMNYVELSLY